MVGCGLVAKVSYTNSQLDAVIMSWFRSLIELSVVTFKCSDLISLFIESSLILSSIEDELVVIGY
jgi:hypothetical protein